MSTSPPPTRAPRAVTPAYVALAVADTTLAGLGARRLRRLTKPLLMPALAHGLLAATAGRPTPDDAPTDEQTGRSSAVRATLVAQALSGGGDVALLGRGETAFLTGLSSFLAGHGGYVAAFSELRRAARDGRAGAADGAVAADGPGCVGPVLAGTAYAVVGPALGRAAGRTSPRLRVPVLVYGGVLCAMVATASRVGPGVGSGARRHLVAGSVLFLVSDGVLGTREFLLPAGGTGGASPTSGDGTRRSPSTRRRQVLDVVVMATYTAAQGLIADGVALAAHAQDTGTTRT